MVCFYIFLRRFGLGRLIIVNFSTSTNRFSSLCGMFYLYLYRSKQRNRNNMRSLTQKEKEIMEILWECGPMVIREMLEHYDAPKPHYNTVATLVKLLVEKGFVEYEVVGNIYLYRAKVSRKQYVGSALGDIISRYYNNSYAHVVSQFIEEDKMDVDELKQLIARIESGRKEE